jgi:hypothetical protein
MATSSHSDAPRGMEFLYSANRMNVATSRAKCICVAVASPRLFEVECLTPHQMQLANAFCRYLELAFSFVTWDVPLPCRIGYQRFEDVLGRLLQGCNYVAEEDAHCAARQLSLVSVAKHQNLCRGVSLPQKNRGKLTFDVAHSPGFWTRFSS